VHVFAGLDVQFSEHVSAGVAVSMHGIGGPHQKPVFSGLFFAGQASFGVKFVF
jgi:hypothetical protein